jgi:hypothetical protein
MEKLIGWCVIVSSCVLAGNGLGLLMDAVLFEISYDYVYPADNVRATGNRWGCWLGTCIAAVSVIGSRPMPTIKWTACAAIVAILITCLAGFAFAVLGWSVVKLDIPLTDGIMLSRAAFCTELVRGIYVGGLTAALIWAIAVWRHRADKIPLTQSLEPLQIRK